VARVVNPADRLLRFVREPPCSTGIGVGALLGDIYKRECQERFGWDLAGEAFRTRRINPGARRGDIVRPTLICGDLAEQAFSVCRVDARALRSDLP
jgi:hypothetical protein